MTFEIDPRKARTNLRKHGVSSEEAVTVFYDPLSSILPDDQHAIEEERWLMVGRSSQQRTLFVVYTERKEVIRLIGARVATAQERADYEDAEG